MIITTTSPWKLVNLLDLLIDTRKWFRWESSQLLLVVNPRRNSSGKTNIIKKLFLDNVTITKQKINCSGWTNRLTRLTSQAANEKGHIFLKQRFFVPTSKCS